MPTKRSRISGVIDKSDIYQTTIIEDGQNRYLKLTRVCV